MSYSYDRRRFVVAAELTWQDVSPEKVSWRSDRQIVFEARTPTGWTYQVKGTQWENEPEVEFWEVSVWEPGENPHVSRRDKAVHPDGKAKRGLFHYRSIGNAKASAERHYAGVKGGWPTDPVEIARSLTPAQRKLLLDAAENGGRLVPDNGLKSERSYRSWLTRTERSLSQSGLLNGWLLTDLGKQVAGLLSRRA